jgi:hypothetical protein
MKLGVAGAVSLPGMANPIPEKLVDHDRVPAEKEMKLGDLVISKVSVRRKKNPESGAEYDEVQVWSRGGGAGTISLNPGDGEAVARWLMPYAKIEVTKAP